MPEKRVRAWMKGTARKITPGYEGCHRDRDPHLLAAPLDRSISSRCTSRRMARASSLMRRPRSLASRLRASTWTRRSTASTSARAAHSRRASVSLRPWRIRLMTREMSRAQAPFERCGHPGEGARERVAGRQQQADLLADHGQLEEQAALPPLRRREICCSRTRKASSGAPKVSSTPTGTGSPTATEARAPSPKAATTQPSWRTRKAVTSRGEWMRVEADAEVLARRRTAGPPARRRCGTRAPPRRGSSRPTAGRRPAGRQPAGRVGPQPLGEGPAGEPAGGRQQQGGADPQDEPGEDEDAASLLEHPLLLGQPHDAPRPTSSSR